MVAELTQRSPVPDPIGSASARLFAAGVERQQRLQCLRFLGILLATADDEGHVHCDPDDLGGLGLLHGMTVEEVNRSRILLETFNVLRREDTGWSIKHFAPVGDDEVPPAEAMAAISRVLARPADDEAVSRGNSGRTSTPISSEQRELEVVVPMEPVRTRRAQRWMAAPVGAAAAAAVVLIALMVSGQMRVPLTSTPASNSNQSAVGVGSTATSAGAAQSPASSPSSSPAATGPATATSSSPTPLGTSAPGTQPSSQVACPAGNVSANVDHVSQHLGSSVPSSLSINVSIPQVVYTSVTGGVANNSPNAVVVNPFPVTVNFTDPSGKTSHSLTATALSAPTPIAPGASAPWSVEVQNPRDAPVPGTATAAPPTWQWNDATVPASCTH